MQPGTSDFGGVCDCVPVGDEAGSVCVCSPSGHKAIVVKVAGKDADVEALAGLDLGSVREALKGRGNIVMTRVTDEDLGTIDLLVESGLFASRSECAAFLIKQGIQGRQDLLERVKDTAEKIRALKDKMRKDIAS
jgi:Arc/MetJ-type ribon-helix-helix transcriptional regulator